jgi:uncharacterized membrane protein YfcA
MSYPLLFLAGVAGGIIAGLLGVGGGIISLAVLPFALSEYGVIEIALVQFIVANSLFGVFFASLAGNIAHIASRMFYPRESLLVGVSGSVMAIFILDFIVVQSWYNRWIFNIVIIIFLIYILLAQFLKLDESRKSVDKKKDQPLRFILAGIAGGALSAASGTGGGAITVPILSQWLGLNIKKAKSISLAMIFLSSGIMTLVNLSIPHVSIYSELQVGLILFLVAIPITAGVVIGAPFGVKISHMMASRVLASIFAILVTVVIIEKLVEINQLLG